MQKNMSEESYKYDRELERRLSEWGKWYVNYVTGVLGYPPMSIEGRIRTDGGILSKGTKLPEPPLNSDAEEMDELINALQINYPAYAKAIKLRYTSLNGLEFFANLELFIKNRLDVSLRTYTNNIRLGKMWLAGRMGR